MSDKNMNIKIPTTEGVRLKPHGFFGRFILSVFSRISVIPAQVGIHKCIGASLDSHFRLR